MKSRISIVVLCYNREDIIGHNLQTLCEYAEQSDCLKEIIVVDNNSSDKSQEIIKEWEKRYEYIRLIPNPDNYGVAKGRNTGMRAAQGEFVIVMDDDSIFKPEELQRFVDKIGEYPKAGIIGFRVINMPGSREACQSLVDSRLYANFHGACAAFRRELFAQIGFLDEGCSFGGEEIDYSIRCRNAGYDLIYLEGIVVEHWVKKHGAAVSLNRRERWLYNYTRVLFKHFRIRNALVFTTRYYVMHIINSVRTQGIAGVWKITKAAIGGARDGLKRRQLVSLETERFYRNKDMRPEYGNVPLTHKLLSKSKTV